MLMTLSSRERNRSCSPLSRRSRGLIEIPPLDPTKRTESQLQIRGNPQPEFARKPAPEPQYPANSTAEIPTISIVNQSLRDISRSTKYSAPSALRSHLRPNPECDRPA